MPNAADLAVLSSLFRTKFDSFSSEERLEYERILQTTFGIKNLRNVQLWTRSGTQQRNFLNTSTAPLELEARIAFCTALLSETPPTSPQKSRSIEGTAKSKGAKLREYLFNDYTRDNVSRITLYNGDILYEYDVYGLGGDDVDDELSDEFEDFGP